MSPLAIAAIVFACSLCAGLIGMALHARLPDHHFDQDSKDVVQLVMGLIATMSALVLGLLVASAKSSYDTQSSALQQISTNLVQLDRILEHFGPETKEARDLLYQSVSAGYERIWPREAGQRINLQLPINRAPAEAFYAKIGSLAPKTDAQRYLLTKALQLGAELQQTRVLMTEQMGSSVPWPFLAVLVFWIAVLFLGFGLFAPFNATVAAALLVGALSVAAAIFLILELSDPYAGLMRLSDMPLRTALAEMAR
ncbi:MAG: DUF4239 domain-containing protein [Acetobacteraceae bacterium]|nr:DUF4239 domain-containing protein [Acetobacteraceae bacterium]